MKNCFTEVSPHFNNLKKKKIGNHVWNKELKSKLKQNDTSYCQSSTMKSQMLALSLLTVQIVTIATLNIFKKRFIGIECKFTRKFRKSSSFTFLTARSEELTPSTLSHFHFVKKWISRKPKTGQNHEYSMVPQSCTRILILTEMNITSLVDTQYCSRDW